MKGRRPLPTSTKALRGTLRKARANPREPEPPGGRLTCPRWLNRYGREAWRELAPLLTRMGVLTKADRQALALLCDAIAEYRGAREVVEREGQTFTAKTEHGTVIRPRPEVAIAQDAHRRARALLVEFGLTPAARPRVNARVPDAGGRENPFAFLTGGRARRDPLEKYLSQ